MAAKRYYLRDTETLYNTTSAYQSITELTDELNKAGRYGLFEIVEVEIEV